MSPVAETFENEQVLNSATNMMELISHDELSYPENSNILIVKSKKELKVYFISKPKYTIGRSPHNDIQIPSLGISRHHATLYKQREFFWVRDGSKGRKSSTNGIAVNKEKCRVSKVADGDTITFCKGTHALFIEPRKGRNAQLNFEEVVQKIYDFYLKCESFDRGMTAEHDFLEAIAALIIKFDKTGRILDLKQSQEIGFGKFNTQIIGQNILDLFSSGISNKIEAHMRAVNSSDSSASFDCKLAEEPVDLFCEFTIKKSSKGYFFAIVRNISVRKSFELELMHKASHDILTGLPNRSVFTKGIEVSIQKRKLSKKYKFAVLFIDLDNFKLINDSLGHSVGDEYIVQIANRLRKCFRPGDMISRLGGDEFAVLLNGISGIDDAITSTKRLQAKLTKPLKMDGHNLLPSASIGIVCDGESYSDASELLRDADLAMYQAKSLGRARFQVFDPAMHSRAVSSLRLDSDLRQALRKNQFKLLYQPIISLKNQELVGFEALIRWIHPIRGVVSPERFIQLSEETGMIIPIGEWVLEECCRQLHRWQSMDGVKLSPTLNINLSAKQFSSPNLTQLIAKLLHHYTLDPNSLKLEITESVVMENSQFAVDIFSQLRDLGVSIYIDDFGTGYSSLSYLHKFPIDALKIDKSFILNTDETSENTGYSIAQAIIGLAHNLGVKVVAEGIEQACHLAWLRTFQCDYGQGYFFAEPLEVDQANALLNGELQWNYMK